IPAGNISFAADLAGPWTLTRNDSATIKYVRVIVPPQNTEVVFAKVIPGIPISAMLLANDTHSEMLQTVREHPPMMATRSPDNWMETAEAHLEMDIWA